MCWFFVGFRIYSNFAEISSPFSFFLIPPTFSWAFECPSTSHRRLRKRQREKRWTGRRCSFGFNMKIGRKMKARFRKSGCWEQHLSVMDCYGETKDWRKCQNQVGVMCVLFNEFNEIHENFNSNSKIRNNNQFKNIYINYFPAIIQNSIFQVDFLTKPKSSIWTSLKLGIISGSFFLSS